MALVDKPQQTTNAQELRDETVPEANTRLRVYNRLKDIIDSSLNYLQVKQASGASTSDVMSQKAISDLFTGLKDGVPSAGDTFNKLYNLITSMGRPRGGFDASLGNVPSPTADNEAGDFWRITVAGTIGAMVLKPGDVLFASIDDAAVAIDFYAIQSNVDQATDAVLGLVKLYTDLAGSNVDGSVTQAGVKTVTDQLISEIDQIKNRLNIGGMGLA